jgi:hypothetical protein
LRIVAVGSCQHVGCLLAVLERVTPSRSSVWPAPTASTPTHSPTTGQAASLSLRMAAVSIPPSPQVLSNMANRRVPLATVPNAANSPYRAVAAAATKRQRAYVADQRDLGYEQPPPAKKQIIEVEDADSRRLAPRRTVQGQPTTLQRKLEAARDPRSRQRSVDLVKGDLREDIKLWREHYRRAFPSYVLYFDAVPDDVRNKIVRDIRVLGSVCSLDITSRKPYLLLT